MWVIVMFGLLIVVFSAMMVSDALVYSRYPISSEYWIAGLFLVGFLAALIGMIIS